MKHADILVRCLKDVNMNYKLKQHVSVALGNVQSYCRMTDGSNLFEKTTK